MKAPKQWLLRAYCQLLCIGTLKLIVISSFWRWGNRASEMWGHSPRSHSDTDWIFASLQNSFFEALIHSVMVISRFGLWKVIRFGWSIKDGISVRIKERDQNTHTHTHTHTLCLSLFFSLSSTWWHSEKVAICKPGNGPYQELNLPAPQFWTSQSQKLYEIIVSH